MKTPKRLQPLVAEGLVDEVLRQLMSGKEATVHIVRCGENVRCAKVYKDANQRSFRKSVSYQEGRKTKNSRQVRAMEKGTRYGRQMQEEAWQSAEVDALYRLAAAGVRVPQPYICTEGVLLMDLVTDAAGNSNAGAMLERDVANLASYFSRFAPELAGSDYGKEIWRLYQAGSLTPESELTGRIEIDHRIADVDAVLEVVKEALLDEERRQLYLAS